MPPLTPDERIGTRHDNTIVVRCPTCGQKRWANIMRDRKRARCTCCSTVVEIVPQGGYSGGETEGANIL